MSFLLLCFANSSPAELKTTFQLPILGVKKNPQSPMYTSLGVLTKGTIIEVNVSELGMVTTGGKVVWSSELRALRLSLTVRIRPDHEQPRKRWLHQLRSPCLNPNIELLLVFHTCTCTPCIKPQIKQTSWELLCTRKV